MTTIPLSKYIIILTATLDAMQGLSQISLPTKKDPNTLTLKDHAKLHLLKSLCKLVELQKKKKIYIYVR